jgi:membrane-associated protease RseP (regulator of RpoE activity)
VNPRRVGLAVLALLILLMCFMPHPLVIPLAD